MTAHRLLATAATALALAAGPAARAGADRIPRRLVDLCRLDALGLHRRQRHHGQMGQEVRHQRRDRADQRLRRVDQPVHRRRLRRLHHDQHGRAVDPRRRRRRHHRADRRRLLERQRRHHPQGRRRRSRDLTGKPVNLVELSVSHYLLARGLDTVGPRRSRPRRVVNTSDADMVAAFADRRRAGGRDLEPAASRRSSKTPARTRSSTRARSPARSSTSWWSTPRRWRTTPTSARRWSAPGTRRWR